MCKDNVSEGSVDGWARLRRSRSHGAGDSGLGSKVSWRRERIGCNYCGLSCSGIEGLGCCGIDGLRSWRIGSLSGWLRYVC